MNWLQTQLPPTIGLIGLCMSLVVTGCGGSGNTPTTTTASPSAASVSQQTESVPQEIRIGYQVIPNAELLAKAQGLVEKQFPNSKISWKQFDSGRDVNTAMASRGIDLGLIGSTGTSTGIARGLPYQVYFIHDVIGDNEALAIRSNANIKSLQDLKGKKLAVPFGSTTHFSLLSALKAEGISSSQVTILDMQPPDMLAAWQRKAIDGGFVWHPTLSKMTTTGGEVLVTAKKLSEKGIVTADVGVVRKEFADKYPEAMKQYVSVLDKAVAFYREKPKEAAAAIAPQLGLSPEESLKVMDELVWLNSKEQADTKNLGTPGSVGDFAKVLKDSADFMVTQKAIPSAPDLSAYQKAIRNDFLQQAK